MYRVPAPGQAFALLVLVLIAGAPARAGSPRATLSPLSPAPIFHPADSAGVVLFALGAAASAEPAPEADLPAEPDTPDEEPADPVDPAESPPADSPRPHPLRAYAVPPARVAQWGFTPEVTRWLPLVESELAALRARRLDHPELVPELVLAVMAAESAGDPLALSTSDAIGLMQLLPSTFSDMIPTPAPALSLSTAGAASPPDPPDPFDPVLNIRAGILYLRQLLIRHDGDVAWAVAGYHAGINASARARWEEQPLYDVTLDYVAQVLTLRERGVPPDAALWASLPAWPPSVPRPLPTTPESQEVPEAPEPAPPEVPLDAGPTITDAEPAPTDPTDPTTELPDRDEVPDMPDEPPATPVPGSPPLATPVPARSDAPESQTEHEDGRDLTARRAAAAASASPSPSPSPSASPSPTATAAPPTATPSPTRTPTPTSSPTVTATPTVVRRS